MQDCDNGSHELDMVEQMEEMTSTISTKRPRHMRTKEIKRELITLRVTMRLIMAATGHWVHVRPGSRSRRYAVFAGALQRCLCSEDSDTLRPYWIRTNRLVVELALRKKRGRYSRSVSTYTLSMNAK